MPSPEILKDTQVIEFDPRSNRVVPTLAAAIDILGEYQGGKVLPSYFFERKIKPEVIGALNLQQISSPEELGLYAAIVGPRLGLNPTSTMPDGMSIGIITDVAKAITTSLIGAPIPIRTVSGLALGTDTSVHEQTILAGGRTIAVMPTDIRHIYPNSNVKLAGEIVGTGTLISEKGNPPRIESRDPSPFYRRNRIIAGLSNTTIFLPADIKSGTANTVHWAKLFQRPIVAIYINGHNPLAESLARQVDFHRLDVTVKGKTITFDIDQLIQIAINSNIQN